MVKAAPKSRKRKSAEAAIESIDLADASTTVITTSAPAAKKAKVSKAPKIPKEPKASKEPKAPKEPKEPKEPKPKPPVDHLDVSGVELYGEDEHEVRVYDTCDTIRRKIRATLAKDGITQAAFLRAIAATAFKDGRNIQSASLSNFMRQKGPLAGNTSSVYYAAYVFFEKRRIKQRKPTTADRDTMEEMHIGGVDTKHVSSRVAYVVGVNSRVAMNKYGKVFSY